MRTSSTFKPVSTSTPPNKNMNPYAQPIRASRSHSTAGTRDRKKRLINSNSSNSLVVHTHNTQPPPIPEPDYSCSGSEAESDGENKCVNKLASRLSAVHLHPVENSGNSNTSGSSTGSSSVAHSFSVEEIQKGRTLLKSSKSYPDDFLKKARDHIVEDADNSSSGVSSDQDVPAGASEYSEKISQEHNSMTLPSPKSQRPLTGLSRNAVSLAQLPPPIETDTDEKEDFCLPPPPEFDITTGVSQSAEPLLAPPPQFSDNRQVTRVRIVGAVHKGTIPTVTNTQTKLKSGRVNSQ